MLCELQEGSLLGALKFKSFLPWELDAASALHRKNYTAFAEKVLPYFINQGYKTVSCLWLITLHVYAIMYCLIADI